jgi:hypothetical protein
MKRRITRVPVLALIVALAVTAQAAPTPGGGGAHKDYVIDGSIVHDVGEVWLNITNWGLIGSQYSVPNPYSDAPSAMWPAGSGVNHLWGAGLWAGAVQNGERLVSTGQYDHEIMALPGAEYTIYALDWQAPGAARYPFADPDDDDDGLEDEDPFNGLDDDLDGLVDEDDAGAGDQMFRAEMVDNSSLAQDVYPDHQPLDIHVVQKSMQWAADDVDDFVGFEYVITNIGDAVLEDVYIGMFSDFDIAPADDAGGGAADDLAGFSEGSVEAYPGRDVFVQVAHMHDGAGLAGSGWAGWAILSHPVRSFQRYSGNAPFEQGGDPTNDLERYLTLSDTAIDGDAVAPGDYRVLSSCGPFASLAPGESLTVAFALVMGADEAEMMRHAARARLVYEGAAFDRDGDPANGDEFVVRWIGPEEMSVSIEDPDIADEVPERLDVAMSAMPNPFNPALEARCYLPAAGQVRLTVLDVRGRRVRTLHDGRVAAGESSWMWDGRDAGGRRVASGVYQLLLETEQRVIRRLVTLVK